MQTRQCNHKTGKRLRLIDRPHFISTKQLVEVGRLPGLCVLDLKRHRFFVTWSVILIENAEWPGKMTFLLWIVEDSCKYLRLVYVALIMNPEIIGGETFIKVDYLRIESIEPYALVTCCAEDEWLAIFEEQCFLRLRSFLCEYFEGPIVEDVAILIDLEEGSTFMLIRPDQHRLQVFRIAIHCSRYKRSIGSDCKSERIEWMIDASERS